MVLLSEIDQELEEVRTGSRSPAGMVGPGLARIVVAMRMLGTALATVNRESRGEHAATNLRFMEVVQRIEGQDQEIQQKFMKQQTEINAVHDQVRTNTEEGVKGSGFKQTIMEMRIVQGRKPLLGDKSKFRQWNQKLGAVLFQVRAHWGQALQEIQRRLDTGEKEDEVQEFMKGSMGDYDEFSHTLYFIMIDKCEGEACEKLRAIWSSWESKPSVACTAGSLISAAWA